MNHTEPQPLSEAIVLYLKHYPGMNDDDFDACYSPSTKERVRAILTEAVALSPDWHELSLGEAGDWVERVMHERHPELTAEALARIGNYFTYLMR